MFFSHEDDSFGSGEQSKPNHIWWPVVRFRKICRMCFSTLSPLFVIHHCDCDPQPVVRLRKIAERVFQPYCDSPLVVIHHSDDCDPQQAVVRLRKIGRTWRWYNLANTAATISTHCCHFICPGTTYIQICMTIHMISYIVITVNILLNHSFWRTHIYPYHYVLEALKLTFHILPYVQLWHLGKFRGWEPFFGSGVQQVPQIVAPISYQRCSVDLSLGGTSEVGQQYLTILSYRSWRAVSKHSILSKVASSIWPLCSTYRFITRLTSQPLCLSDCCLPRPGG